MTGVDEDECGEVTGWKPLEVGGFMDGIGPLLATRSQEEWRYGLDTDARHLNPIGLVHGGVTASLIDHAFAMVAWEASGRAPTATVQMDIRYLGAARKGDRLEASAVIRHQTGSMLFVDADVHAAGRAIASASAIMKIIRPSSGTSRDTQ